jgi:hypothetical protein
MPWTSGEKNDIFIRKEVAPMKLKAGLCILLTALLLCSCAPVTTPASTTTQPTTGPTQGSANGPLVGLPISADTAQGDQQALFDGLFELNNKISLRLHMDEHQIALLQQDYEDYSSWGSKSPIYRMADLEVTVGDDTYLIRQVGVRMKGNTSRTDFYSPEEGIHSLIHLKLDFQETFDDPDHYTGDSPQTHGGYGGDPPVFEDRSQIVFQ